MLLNPQQQEAVNHVTGPLLILAGAGSGKTRVIVHRIANLIEKHKVNPLNILAVTFTNKAAAEMRRRLETMLNYSVRDLWISTFHSACLRILRRHPELVGLKPNFQILGEGGQLSLIKECFKELDVGERLISHESALSKISRAKDQCKGPEEFGRVQENFYQKKLSDIFLLYQKKLSEINAADFGDLIRLVVVLFEKNPEILASYQRRFLHVMVDEYQDTNHAQYRLISTITGTHKNICVVGDDDQSIYKWRGADISNILHFEKDFPGANIIKLEQNYRSTKTILDASHAIISNNTGRKPKKLWTESSRGQPVSVISCSTEAEEAKLVLDEISLLRDKYQLNNIAIFYRTNAQSRPLEDIFIREKMPYRIFGGVRFYERAEIKDIIAYLRLIVEPNDNLSFSRIVNVPTRGIGKETVAQLKNFAEMNGKSLFESIKEFARTTRPGVAQKLARFHELIEDLRKDAMDRPLTPLIQDVLKKTDYLNFISTKAGMDPQDRMENISEFIAAMDEFKPITEEPLLIQFLDQAALISDLDGLSENNNAVTMMTAHLAKGLEFDVVFMVGMEEGLFPHSRSLGNTEEEEEERRLCYVGMTRAKERLIMSHAFRRNLFGQQHYSAVSRFIDEIPAEYVQLTTSHKKYFVATDDRLGFEFDQRPPEERFGLSRTPYAVRNTAFGVGSRIHHPTFGSGIIKHCEKSTAGHKITVQFQNGLIKKLVAEKAGIV